MGRGAKIAVVCAGYLLAFIAGAIASALYNARVSALPYDTSGGMYAAGESMTALGAFLAVALAPTLLALWFLRGSPRLWQTIALASFGFAGAGLLAVLMPVVTHDISSPAMMGMELLRIAHLLGMPLWTVAFVLFAFLAPTRVARRLLFAAIGVELAVGICAVWHWFVPSSPL